MGVTLAMDYSQVQGRGETAGSGGGSMMEGMIGQGTTTVKTVSR